MSSTRSDLLERLERVMREGALAVRFEINWLAQPYSFQVSMKGQFKGEGDSERDIGYSFYSGGDSLRGCIEKLITDAVREKLK